MDGNIFGDSLGQPRNKKDIILMAATKIFAAQGFHQAKIEDIANEAGIGKGTIYQYFDNKKQLFEEMVKEGTRMYLEKSKESLDEGSDIFEKLRNFLYMHRQLIYSNKDMATIMITDHTEIGEDTQRFIRGLKGEVFGYLRDVINQAISKGEIREINQNSVVVMFMGMVGKISSQILYNHHYSVDQETIEGMLDIFFKGIKS